MTARSKEIRELVARAERQGWRIAGGFRAGRHTLLLAPDRVGMVTISSSPSDAHWRRHVVAALRRHGFVWERRS